MERSRSSIKRFVVFAISATACAAAALWASRGPAESPLARGLSAYGRGDWNLAAEVSRDRLKTEPNDLEALRLLARASARQARDDVAQRLFLRVGPDSWLAEDFYLLASAMTRQGRGELAFQTLLNAKKADPDHPETLRRLSRIWIDKGKLEIAAQTSERLIELPGWELEGAAILGEVRRLQGDDPASLEAFERGLKGIPRTVAAEANLEVLRKELIRGYLRAGRPGDAERLIERIPRSPEVERLLSRARLQQGRIEEAAAAIERAEGFGEDRPTDPEPSPYVGEAACSTCHSAIFRSRQASRHAKTFRKQGGFADVALPDKPLEDPARKGGFHAFRTDKGRPVIETTFEGKTLRAFADFAFGSGDRGLTFVGREESGELPFRELRLSRYSGGSVWDVTTGQEPSPKDPADLLGRPLDADELRQCRDCHTTREAPEHVGPRPEEEDRGIGCERCHGPAGHHVLAIKAELSDLAIARPKKASPAQVIKLCGTCHDGVPEASTTSAFSARFQASALSSSRCFVESGGGLSCVTCHDPHRDAETSHAFYEEKCRKCHTSEKNDVKASVCKINPKSDCLSCHMPPTRAGVRHSTFTDHRIRVRR